MPAFRVALLACLTLALAAPAGALAAGDEADDCRGSRASAALGEGACESTGSPSQAALADDSPVSDDDAATADRRPSRAERPDSTAGDPSEESNDRPRRSSGGDEQPSSTDEDEPRRSRAEAALDDSGSGRSLEEELDEQADEMRREARARRAETRRRARSAEREASGDRGDAKDSDARDGEIRVTIAGSGDQITLLPGRRDILVNARALVRGYFPGRRAGSDAVLEVLTGGRWVAVDRDTTDDEGRFHLAWYPGRPGYFRVRVRPYSTSSSVQPSNPRLLYIYRRAIASWYGPGFYGNRTACGQTFTSTLLGVAHRSLPCGHRLTVRYNGVGRTVTVVDRGPFIDGRDYDLTEGLADYLGFRGVDEVWVTA